ncbi:MAG TPA: flavodoxin-dependent (E)-4-hydroxy-3-methylbut-2-enyl-diphosphate synthase, partial [Myxococcota bacterium]|nr:flavodoxin-dependent (E)-4-hydroxy-3-methylbut-2-enyl-diphosphate synthase [Myxococcota bacterium]
AGDGEDGRIKSAIGIGALLVDGIGDTVRVSLTEPPEQEVPVARAIAALGAEAWRAAPSALDPGAPFSDDPYAHSRRATRSMGPEATAIGGDHPVRVEIDLGAAPADPKRSAESLVRSLRRHPDLACEGLALRASDAHAAGDLRTFADALADAGMPLPLALRVELGASAPWPAGISRVVASAQAASEPARLEEMAQRCARAGMLLEWHLVGDSAEICALVDRALDASAHAALEHFIVSIESNLPIHAARIAAARLAARGAADVPIALRHRRREGEPDDTALLRAACSLGAPLCDGIGDAVALEGFGEPARALDLAYRILQGARRRTSRTEYISCPSCGRTLFDLVETTERIKARTSHLAGVKIAIMGCIVNGPGEMADADFGYVGSGPGRVNLYVGKELVVRNVPDTTADDRLVELIRERGRWVDPA